MRKRLLAVLATGAAALVTAAVAVAATVIVHPGNMNGWAVIHDTCGAPTTGAVGFVNGPGSPPAGVGSVRYSIGANGDSYETLRTRQFNGVRLDALTSLNYWTWVTTFGTGGQAVYIDLYVDWNNDEVRDDIITFEPVYQGAQGPVVLGAWQDWNALNGGLWWSSNMGGPPPFFTLAAYIAAHPGAEILGGLDTSFILATGCGGAAWTGFNGFADKLTVGVSGANTTFDFEPSIGPPTRKAQCKKGGWKNFNNPPFKNQGQCVAYVNHHDGKGKDG
jgi:hypothetical protein